MTDDLPYRPCVGVMLLNADGDVFVGQRLDHPGGAWQMPQGGIDPGETPRIAALRELGEETGIAPDLVEIVAESEEWIPYELPPELQGKLWGGKYRGQTQKWVLMRFHGVDDDVNIATAEPEFSAWMWTHPSDLVPRIVPFKRAVYRHVIETFRSHL